MLKERYEYKEQAKKIMMGRYEPTIIVVAIFGAFQSLVSIGQDQFSTKRVFVWTTNTWRLTQIGNPFMLMLVNVIGVLVGAMAAFALMKMFISIAREQAFEEKDVIFSGFKNSPIKNIALLFITRVFVMLWSLLLIVPGVVKAYAYSMNFYLLHREPTLSAMEAIDKSKKITMGYKMELLMLDLSYLGWYLLGILTLGILWLWIIPKHQTARVLYLDEIYSNTVTNKEIAL